MASYLFNVNTLSKYLLRNTFNLTIGSFRNASKGSSHPKKANHGRPSRHGWKRADNSIVKRSTLLYHQIRLKVFPGLNVGIGRIAKLYAKVPGKVVISCENTVLDSENSLVQYNFPNHPPPFRQYVNVIPEPNHQRFKLVEKF